ncbi:phytanoyl-CoA dioxygenase family protein [Cryptococcus neoformans var. grubii Br795]|nr:phytanoyl-CoA dioxygenase family protein [Cryptococcus neoformans var. grubii MW-RSA36]OXG85426.1 phytanoyl-CoA dioxygenase family protein [Cryptococcus neoformans var. grubii Br795]OXG89802.1 phytanoyl-CoA dioxygenase family protein [Cryptococcus neoformans var. grubii D17-1]OXG97238.1 phytanoyl-CoA dioxygenase family protein [Cryptococcus neoformans var. grubii A2-102-5]OXL09294.1 phytanoyl-CoA dioxygenase family protein [Cryptococcus neoformans var. grubii Gb118]
MSQFNPDELSSFREHYHTHGYVIVPSLIPDHLFPLLRESADHIVNLSRSGKWDNVRIVGKPFPPWDAKDKEDIWGVQNVMHPDLGQKVFAEWYGSEEMLEVSRALMGCEQEDMQFELFNLLINPTNAAYTLVWHRDDVKPTATPQEEIAALQKDYHGIQWNAALYDDECLSVVPKSHLRVSTPDEKKALLGEGEMPGGIKVKLKAGETVFYNNHIIHIGSYDPTTKRRTLHGCYGCPPSGDTSRARNILQHDLSYTLDPKFRNSVPGKLKGMVDKLNGMQRLLEGQVLEYSQD